MLFELVDSPIEPSPVANDGAGGFVSFEGRVRDHADGKRVLRLEYEAYAEMAVSEGEALVREAIEQFDLLAACVVHRVGVLEIGDVAVHIQTAASHRREAFAACEWIIDQLKVRVPIWKRETYEDGDSGWVGVGTQEAFDDGYFDRQTRLPEIGQEGQEKLAAARVLLVGVGGLGSGSLPYLVAAGVGTIGLVDGDLVEVSNLHRQVIFQAADVGRSKVERAASFAKRLRPGMAVEAYPEDVTEENVDKFVDAYDWIVDGTDSLAVKQLLNRACRRLAKPLVTASVHRFEGQFLTVLPDGPCLECLFPEWPEDGCVGTCAEVGVLGVVPGLLGQMQATEVLKGILGFGEVLSNRLLVVDLRTLETTSIERGFKDSCQGCRGVPLPRVEVGSLEQAGRLLGTFDLIDIRDVDEEPPIPLPHRRIPLSEFEPGKVGAAVLICQSGVRSRALALRLRKAGRSDVVSLRGGLVRLAANVQRI